MIKGGLEKDRFYSKQVRHSEELMKVVTCKERKVDKFKRVEGTGHNRIW